MLSEKSRQHLKEIMKKSHDKELTGEELERTAHQVLFIFIQNELRKIERNEYWNGASLESIENV